VTLTGGSRGLFAGVSLNGAGIVNDRDTNADFAKGIKPETVKAIGEMKLKLHEIAKEKADLPGKP
jgi:lipid-binding SYLF domain-containing protein